MYKDTNSHMNILTKSIINNINILKPNLTKIKGGKNDINKNENILYENSTLPCT